MLKKFVSFIALRYIKTRLITIFSIIGIAIGVMVLIVVISVMDGFIREFRTRLQGTLSDIIVTVRTPHIRYNEIEDKIMSVDNVKACAPHMDGLVLIGTGRHYAGGLVTGIDYEKEFKVGKFQKYLVTAYKSKKLGLEKVFDENVRRDFAVSISWKAKSGEEVTKQGIYPAGTRIVCEKIVNYTSTGPSLKPVVTLVAYTFNENNKIIFEEENLPASELEHIPALSAEAQKKWQQIFNNMASAFSSRKLGDFMSFFDEYMRTDEGEIDPQDPFATEEEGVRPIILGHSLMLSLGLKRGDEIGLMTGRRDIESDELKPITRKFMVVGSFRSGWQDIDARTCYTKRMDLHGFIDWPSDVKEVSVAVKDYELSDATRDNIFRTLNGMSSDASFQVQRWEEQRSTFLTAIKMERDMMKIILFFIVVLATATIMIILILLVAEKTKDIGILKSMGASNFEIMQLFLFNGAFISFLGCILGCIFGCLISIYANEISDIIFVLTKYRIFDKDVYYLDSIPSELTLSNILWIIFPTLIVSLLFCSLPAYRAASMEPVRALGAEFNFGKKSTNPVVKHKEKNKDKDLKRMKDSFFAIENLIKEYQMPSNKLRILNGLNLNIVPGKITVIIGPSGSGKSTILHLLGLLDTPTDGDIYLEGINLDTLWEAQKCKILNKKIGFIFQFYHLFPEFTALENVLIATMIDENVFSWKGVKKERIKMATELLSRFGLKDRLDHLPSQLSGGERQRVAIARALINNPQIVLCDEPTGNLDEENSQSIQNLIWELNKQMDQTFVIVTHDLGIASQADYIYKLEHGKLIQKNKDNLLS